MNTKTKEPLTQTLFHYPLAVSADNSNGEINIVQERIGETDYVCLDSSQARALLLSIIDALYVLDQKSYLRECVGLRVDLLDRLKRSKRDAVITDPAGPQNSATHPL